MLSSNLPVSMVSARPLRCMLMVVAVLVPISACVTHAPQQSLDRPVFWRGPEVSRPEPPPQLPEGAIVRVIRRGGQSPHYVIIDEGSGDSVRSTAEGWLQYGIASWYGPGFHGRTTANGERYNQNEMTAAHRTLPFGSRVKVTNLHNGESCIVRINDRGPYWNNRIIDLSRAAARELSMVEQGVSWVRLDLMEESPDVTMAR